MALQYRYLAYTLEGGVTSGRVEARDVAEATSLVRQRGYKLLRVAPAWKAPSLETLFPSLFSVNTGELVRLSRQLATMLSSGGNLLRTLEMLATETHNRALRRTLQDIRQTLDDGGSLSAALAQHPKVFSPLFVSVVEVGEYTGRLGPALEQMADMLEKDREAKQKAIRTMMYPMAIMGLSLITMGVLMTVALPPLLKVFSQMGSSVPMMTRIAINLVAGIKANFLSVFIGIIAVGIVFGLLKRIPKTRYWLDLAQTKAPVLGGFTVAGELARFARTITLLLEAGVPLATALRLATSGCKNQALRRAFNDAEESLVSGHGFAEALKRHSVLPMMFVQLVVIGEESNSLRRTLGDAANAYQQQMEHRLDSLLALMEPVSTLVVGGIVGFIAFSMFVPIYSGLNSFK